MDNVNMVRIVPGQLSDVLTSLISSRTVVRLVERSYNTGRQPLIIAIGRVAAVYLDSHNQISIAFIGVPESYKIKVDQYTDYELVWRQ